MPKPPKIVVEIDDVVIEKEQPVTTKDLQTVRRIDKEVVVSASGKKITGVEQRIEEHRKDKERNAGKKR